MGALMGIDDMLIIYRFKNLVQKYFDSFFPRRLTIDRAT